MYGLLIESVCEFIREKFGEQSWLKIRDKSRVHEYTFVTHRMYSEKIIPRLAQAVHDVTGYSKEQFMDEQGVQFVKFLNKYDYDKMLRVLGRSLRDFLNGLDNLHEYLRFSYPKMKPPSFFCTDENLDGLTLHYRTRRAGYTHYVKGQLRQVAKQFYNREVTVVIVEEKQTAKDNLYVKYRITFDNKEFTERARLSTAMNGHAQLNANLFFDVFPFHVVFGHDMRIRNVGRGLKAVLPDLEGQLLTDAFDMKRPNLPFTWESISTHENNVFELASTSLITRDTLSFGCPIIGSASNDPAPDEEVAVPDKPASDDSNVVIEEDGDSSESGYLLSNENGFSPYPQTNHVPAAFRKVSQVTTSSEGSRKYSIDGQTCYNIIPRSRRKGVHEILEEVYHPRQIRIKGQMLCIPEWRAYIFLATPMLPDLNVMFQTGLYINDLSMHDSSRDLVLAGTQQSAELKLALDQEQRKSAQLEESMMKLDLEMKRTDSLLYQMIPRQVAEKLRRGEPATSTCEVFTNVTILFSDVVGFTTICSRIPPMAVVSMLNGMYTKFDNLSEKYDVYKVETIGDAYMVVSGAPTTTKYHAVRIVEMSLGMLDSMNDLKDPSSNEIVKIRVGIHTGMVVAGVVGLKMPRYCLFGDTVNTASRMESTGEAMKIHMSETTKTNIDKWPNYYKVQERGTTVVKNTSNIPRRPFVSWRRNPWDNKNVSLHFQGKGSMKTYWLLGKDYASANDCPLSLAKEEKGTCRSRQSSIDSSPVLKRSIAGSRLAINEDSRNGSATSRPYTPVVISADVVEQALTQQVLMATLTANNSSEKLSMSSTETIKPNPAAGDRSTLARRDSKESMYTGYVPVTPSIGDNEHDFLLKSSCTCRENVMVTNKEVQTEGFGSTVGRQVYDDSHRNREAATQGNGSDRGQRVTTSLDSGKGQANVAHSSACIIV